MMGCNVIFICRSMDESKQLLRDVASAVYELDLLFPPTEPSSSSAAGGSAPPPPPSSEPQSSSITFAQDTNGGSRSLSQKEDTSVGQQEQANRTQDSSGFGTEETQPSSHVVQPDDSEATQVVSQEQDPSLVSQEYQGEEESERRGSPTFDAYGIGSGDNDDVEQQQYLVEKKYETEGDSVVYQEESSPEIETSPFDSKDVVEAETPDVAEEATKDVAGEKSQEGIEDWEIDSTARGEDKESMTTPTVAVFGFGSKDVVEQQQQPLAVEDPTDELASEGTRSGSAHWEIETPPQLPESHWEGEGWGVPPPAAFDASTVKSPSPPAPFSWPPAAAANSLTPSSTLSPSTSTSQPLPSSPESPKASTSWASVAKVPAPVAPLPTPSNPPHHFPQTHSRTPTYIHTPSPVPSTCRSSSSRSSNPNGLPLDLTPLLTVISWSLPDRRPHQSKVNDILLENEPDFYRKHGGRRWKSYSEAAAEAGLVEMGTDAKNGQWISLTKKGLAKIGRK
ncbi:hypothetical protein BDY24DRAFT_372990 [Mrakia frigida]|uniref:uncharacterized protein n=1 Tax=Mrakia frigida TaxID=29902 RepID=UPI003FCC1FCF